jgi:hypothetical protein
MKRLQGEKEKRLAEMGKIDTLDEKIPVELGSLKEKVRLSFEIFRYIVHSSIPSGLDCHLRCCDVTEVLFSLCAVMVEVLQLMHY